MPSLCRVATIVLSRSAFSPSRLPRYNGQCPKFTRRVHAAPSARLKAARVQGFLPDA